MQERLNEWIRSLGLDFEINLSGLENHWHKVTTDAFKGSYIFRETKVGDAVSMTVTLYNFKTAEHKTYRFDSRALTPQEVEAVDKARKEQEERLEAEKLRVQLECKEYCEKEFAKHEYTTNHPYLVKKGVKAPDGTLKVRNSEINGEPELLCPMSDASGCFWGYQIISETRGKQFGIGQRTQGCFVPFGLTPKAKRIYLVEGVATALSVFEAIGGAFPVLACLSAANLLSVSRSVRAAFPKASIVAAGDNDQFTKTGNTGKTFAERVEAEVDGAVSCIPDFTDITLETRPTDFNDLHLLAGLDVVQAQITKVELVRPEYFWPLGYDGPNYFFTTLRSPTIHTTKDFGTTDLLKILTQKKWAELYPETVSLKTGKIDWEPIKSDLIDKAQKRGEFQLSDARGLGLYMEKEGPLVHLGNRVLYQGQEVDLQDLDKVDGFYALRSKRNLPPRPEVNKQKEFIQTLTAILRNYRWELESSPELLIGWIYCSIASGAIPWRPHLLVSAEAGSGKSTILNMIVAPLLRYANPVLFVDGTEASIRQTLKNDSAPVIHDEFDTNRGELKKLLSVLNLIRASSSGGTVRRGTPTGKALQFEAKFSAYLTGINPPPLNEADQSRITHLRAGKSHTAWDEQERMIIQNITPDAAAGCFWQVLDTIQNFKGSFDTLHKALSAHGSRAGQQYGSLLAGFWHMFHVEQITKAKAEKFVSQLEQSPNTVLTHEDNAMQCYDWLMQYVVEVRKLDGSEKITLATAVHRSLHSDVEKELWQAPLDLAGVKVTGDFVFVASHSKALLKHFEGTQWASYCEALRRVPGSEKGKLRVGGRPLNGVKVKIQE